MENKYNVCYDFGHGAFEGKGYYLMSADSDFNDDYQFTAKVGDEWVDRIGFIDDGATLYSTEINVDESSESWLPEEIDDDIITYEKLHCKIVEENGCVYIDQRLN